MNDNLEEIKRCLEEFSRVEVAAADRFIISEREALDAFFTRFNLFMRQRASLEEETSPAYNIFYILKGVIDKEELTHSPFLGDLLDINGKHNQGALFFKELCTELGIQERFVVNDPSYFSMTLEKWMGEGEIDILLQYSEGTKRFAMAIENKIFAKDRPNQLEKYAGYLENVYQDNFQLIYLTPDGAMPALNYSISAERYAELTDRGLLKVISYHHHIY
ncbi:MAG: hypothetical protein EOP50_11095, partial [Sphingobacteriales bacterium]